MRKATFKPGNGNVMGMPNDSPMEASRSARAGNAQERFMWTLELIDAVLALRFQDAGVKAAIERAVGNDAKRKAWRALADRLAKDRCIAVSDNKLRRVVSKWQSQYRSWKAATTTKTAAELARMERPPTYMPVLERYFSTQEATAVIAASPRVTTIPFEYSNGIVTPVRRSPMLAVPRAKSSAHLSRTSSTQRSTALSGTGDGIANMSRLSTRLTKSPSPATTVPMPIQHPIQRADASGSIRRSEEASDRDVCATELVQTMQRDLALQRQHFEDNIALLRRQFESQFATQHQHLQLAQSLFFSVQNSRGHNV